MNEIRFKIEKSNGFNSYTAVINGVELKITCYRTKTDHSLINPYELYMKGLPYRYGGYSYRTLKEAKEAAIKLVNTINREITIMPQPDITERPTVLGNLATCDCGL